MHSRGIKSRKWLAQWLGDVCSDDCDNLTWCQFEHHVGSMQTFSLRCPIDAI